MPTIFSFLQDASGFKSNIYWLILDPIQYEYSESEQSDPESTAKTRGKKKLQEKELRKSSTVLF